MTTLAYKDGVLAVDSCVTHMNTLRYDLPKLFVFEGLGAIAICGNTDCSEAIARWIFNGCKDFKPGAGQSQWAAYYLTKGKLLFAVTDQTGFRSMDIANPEADGSGCDIAHTAMYLRCDAIAAVETACQLDPHTGGSVCWYDADTGSSLGAKFLTLEDLEPVESKLPKSP